ncbi:hypothetical protein ACSNOJ_08550 [Streptomyces sp. URMC 128]|uniref:hypothetical protein n=1 Tax=Streptomyces sp. URMC 128 TaxID=3423404 RepID=UPI003F1BFF48
MNSFLAELGKKVADRWWSLFAFPGLLFLVVLALGRELGHRQAWDTRLLSAAIDREIRHYSGNRVSVVLVAVVFVAAAACIGMLVHWAGSVVEECWLTAWRSWPASRLISARRNNWESAHRAYKAAERERRTAQGDRRLELDRSVDRYAAKRNRVSLIEPEHATWMGDRMYGCALRVRNQYGLELGMVWARLWITLPDAVRTDVRTARTHYAAACALTVWGVLYTVVGAAYWYPAAVVGCCACALAWWRARRAVGTLADLVEAAVDVHSAQLATSLGFELPDLWVTPGIGAAMSERIRKAN